MTIDFNDARGRELTLLIERGKYERWLSQETGDVLERTWNGVVDRMLSPGFRTLTKFQQQRIAELAREVDRILKSGYVDVTQLHLREMKGYAALEADVARAQVRSLLSEGGAANVSLGATLPRNYLASIAKLPIQGLNIGQWFSTQAATMSREARRLIQQGLVAGKGIAAIASRLLAGQRADGPVLSRRAAQEAKMISRTTVNAVQNDATRASNSALPRSISDSYRWVSVRDRKTSVICIALDGRVFKYDGDGAQYPPAHIGCRSTTAPLIKGASVSLADQRSSPLTMRSFDEWLKSQDLAAQNAMLGPTRAGLWRDGRMTLADAIDSDNRVLTLSQLRARLGVGTRAGALAGV